MGCHSRLRRTAEAEHQKRYVMFSADLQPVLILLKQNYILHYLRRRDVG
jgi:hypothetical protein